MESLESAEAAEVETFFAREWPAWDEDVEGVAWKETRHHLVIREDGAIRAAAHFSIVGGVGRLGQILVRKEDGGRGVGSRLLAEVERVCRTLGCHKLRLETAEYQARSFYEKQGFSLTCTLEDDRFHYALHLMEKRLAAGDAASHGLG